MPPGTSLIPSHHLLVFHASSRISIWMLLGSPTLNIMATSWQPTLKTWHPHTTSQARKRVSSESCESQEKSQHVSYISLAQRGWHTHSCANHMAGDEPIRTLSWRWFSQFTTHQATCPRTCKRVICKRKLGILSGRGSSCWTDRVKMSSLGSSRIHLPQFLAITWSEVQESFS